MKIFYTFLAVFFFYTHLVSAAQVYEVTKDTARIRVDSAVSSDRLGFLKRGDLVEVVREKFEWYQIVLPEDIPCYVFSKLSEVSTEGSVRIKATNVNLRYQPSLESPIIGKALKNEIFSLIEESGEWLKVKNNSRAKGWVHKKFLKEQDLAGSLALLEEKLAIPGVDSDTIYSTIAALTDLGKDNLKLTIHFLESAKKPLLKEASVYLDILQNILKPQGQTQAYFYQAQNNSLSDQDVQKALTLFQTMVDAKPIE